MGPVTLFDKSFLQSLNIDESVWFDHFFTTNICPLFYVETLADLNKSVRNGRTPEREVAIIADKFPEMHGTPNMLHASICLSELHGNPVPMTGQILLAGGRPVRHGDRTGMVFDKFPEAEAFSRWHKQEFSEIERLYASNWRKLLAGLDLGSVASQLTKLNLDITSCKSLDDAKMLADQMVSSSDKPFDRMKLALTLLNIHPQYHQNIFERWSVSNYPSIKKYAPYAAHVLTVEIFFQISIASGLISSKRASNRVDIAYLFYLPFTELFVSTDKLHKKCAPLFLRSNQSFIWGVDLKSGLKAINEHYLKYPIEEREKGIMAMSSNPPDDGKYYVTKIWDNCFPGWRKRKNIDKSNPKFDEKKLLKHVKEFHESPTVPHEDIDFDISDTDNLSLTRVVRKSKGTWYQIPKNYEEDE